ncbi:prenyltransferase/squalene oxidase repeat-containing protein [Symbiobacterium thermophilum]|uniref:Conserved domain protein n=2 Tax=Symbiobacterium thermophilum TaxID=2734 RepID=Q67P32_SYMTH|nr:prenyltransferase/squalene oxidase repeat-containing protein [Symbiobacterium thermophilum]MBY6276958.1 hypothetical protein [Symbiobacterium thermophilum]OTA42309.1 MAG: hypothetical protein A6D92_00195 [Symbiobacterium thermophilum]BAD40561.1 conserved domain protein [Symbiobacterium thermophilum IAM 14863]
MALPQIDVARAKAFVMAHGSAVDVTRLEGILGRDQPDRSVVRTLEERQNPDGGFPVDAPGASSVVATCTLIQWLRDIPPLAGAPMAGRAVSFVRRSQQVDGSWIDPGTTGAAAQAYMTARAVYTLLVAEPDHPDPIARGARWLRGALEDGTDQADTETLILAAAIWSRPPGGGPGDALADAAYASLRDRALSPRELALWLTTFVDLGLAARHLGLAVGLLDRLAGLQQPDGGWPAEDGGRVDATLGALRAFRGFGLIGPAF